MNVFKLNILEQLLVTCDKAYQRLLDPPRHNDATSKMFIMIVRVRSCEWNADRATAPKGKFIDLPSVQFNEAPSSISASH
jgi:hypothetical protein